MLSKKSVVTIMLVLLTITGCNQYKSVKPNLGKTKAEIILKPGKFKLVKTIHAEATSYFLFWIDISPFLRIFNQSPVPVISFRLGHPDLYTRAMRDLHRQHDLQGKPQILHNFLEEWTLANYLGLYAVQKLSISAEVIEFTATDKEEL